MGRFRVVVRVSYRPLEPREGEPSLPNRPLIGHGSPFLGSTGLYDRFLSRRQDVAINFCRGGAVPLLHPSLTVLRPSCKGLEATWELS